MELIVQHDSADGTLSRWISEQFHKVFGSDWMSDPALRRLVDSGDIIGAVKIIGEANTLTVTSTTTSSTFPVVAALVKETTDKRTSTEPSTTKTVKRNTSKSSVHFIDLVGVKDFLSTQRSVVSRRERAPQYYRVLISSSRIVSSLLNLLIILAFSMTNVRR